MAAAGVYLIDFTLKLIHLQTLKIISYHINIQTAAEHMWGSIITTETQNKYNDAEGISVKMWGACPELNSVLNSRANTLFLYLNVFKCWGLIRLSVCASSCFSSSSQPCAVYIEEAFKWLTSLISPGWSPPPALWQLGNAPTIHDPEQDETGKVEAGSPSKSSFEQKPKLFAGLKPITTCS